MNKYWIGKYNQNTQRTSRLCRYVWYVTPFNTDIFFTPSPSYQLFIDLVPHIPRYASYNSNKSFVSSNLIMHSDLCFSLDYVVRFSSLFCFSVRRFAGSFASKSLFVSVCCYVHFHCNLQLFLYTFFFILLSVD